jgi:hypothetical protein
VQLLLLYLAGGTLGSLAHCGWYYYQACKTGKLDALALEVETCRRQGGVQLG